MSNFITHCLYILPCVRNPTKQMKLNLKIEVYISLVPVYSK